MFLKEAAQEDEPKKPQKTIIAHFILYSYLARLAAAISEYLQIRDKNERYFVCCMLYVCNVFLCHSNSNTQTNRQIVIYLNLSPTTVPKGCLKCIL